MAELDDESENTTVCDQPVCPKHHRSLAAHCKPCDVLICDQCCTVGEHMDHQPVHLLDKQDIQWREKLARTAGNLNSEVLTDLEKALDATGDMNRQLAARTDEVLQQIRTAGRLAVEAVELYVKQVLQEVDDVQARHQRTLNEHRDELHRHLRDVRETGDFSNDLRKQDIACARSTSAYQSLEKRVSGLIEAKLTAMPGSNPGVIFRSASLEQVQAKVRYIVGTLFPCYAWARHSAIAGIPGPVRNLSRGQRASYLLQARDGQGQPLSGGGDVVSVQWKETPVKGAESSLAQVEDKGNGQYAISCMLQEEGKHLLDVIVNGDVMSHAIPLHCHSRWCFDPAACSEGITLSNDGFTATHSSDRSWKSVLATPSMTSGVYNWSIKISSTKQVDNFVGVAVRGKLDNSEGNYRQTYSWTNDGRKWVLNKSELVMSDWKDGDKLDLEMNCDAHEMKIANCRSGETSVISELPSEELVPYFAMYYTHSSASFVQ